MAVGNGVGGGARVLVGSGIGDSTGTGLAGTVGAVVARSISFVGKVDTDSVPDEDKVPQGKSWTLT